MDSKTDIKKPNLSGLRGLSSLTGLAAKAGEDTILLLDPSEIEAPKQVRTKFKNIEELRATMDAEGQQSPIIVGPKKPNGKYELYKGGRRLKAALIAPTMKLKAIVDTRDWSSKRDQAVMSQLIENIQREDLLPHEIGRALLLAREIAEHNGETLTNREMCTRIGKSEAYVSTHLAIAELPEELTALIENEVTRDADILNNLRLLRELNTEVYQRVLDEVNAGGPLDRASAREAVRLAKAIKTGEVAPTATSLPKTEPASPAAIAVPAPPAKQAPEATGLPAEPAHDSTQDSGAPPQNLQHAEGHAPGTTGQEAVRNEEKLPHAEAGAQSVGSGGPATPPPETAPQEQDPQAKKSVRVNPADLIIFVRVVFDETVETGHLHIDRVSPHPTKVWVSLVQDGKEVSKLVSADSVQIVSIHAKTT